MTDKKTNTAKKAVKILGIETSCDETAAAVVMDGREVLSNVVATQIDIHRRYGGVVPEIASRNHTLDINGVVDEALAAAGLSLFDLDAVAVTHRPGLLGALIVGVSSAKAIAYAAAKPLVAVNHIEAHIAANYIAHKTLTPPFLALVASGGHTQIYDVKNYTEMTLLGGTADDAIGEAFDKVARVLGLPYPGGPEIDRLAKEGRPVIRFMRDKTPNADYSLSYSGLKTAAINYIHTAKQRGETLNLPDIAASLTAAAVDILVDTALLAAKNTGRGTLVLSGGVAANSYLRERLSAEGKKSGIAVVYPPLSLCGDNAAMVAARAYYSFIESRDIAPLSLNAFSH